MQVALGIQATNLKKAKPKQPAEPHPQMFDVRAECDAVLFKRTMTLNALRALSGGDTINFPKAALEPIILRSKEGRGMVSEVFGEIKRVVRRIVSIRKQSGRVTCNGD